MRSDNPGASEEAIKKSADAERQIKMLIMETHATEESFLNSMKKLAAYMQSDKEALYKRLKPKEIDAVELILASYNGLAGTSNVFAKFPNADSTTTADRIKFFNEKLAGHLFQDNIKEMHKISAQYKVFTNILNKLAADRKIKADPTLTQHLYEIQTQPGYAVQANQRWPRYEMLAATVKKNYASVIGADKEIADSLKNNLDEIIKSNVTANVEMLRADADFMIREHIDSLIRENKNANNPEIRKLRTLARDIQNDPNINKIQDKEELTRTLMQFYVDSYLDYRERGLSISTSGVGYGTVKAPFLQELEESLIKAFDLRQANNKDQNNEDIILSFINTTPRQEDRPSIRSTVINNLFARTMAEGVAGNNQLAFVNAVKQVVKMRPGTGAMEEWNSLAAKFTNGAAIKMAKPDLSEGEIRKMFDEGVKNNVALRTEMKDSFVSDVLISLLKKDRPKGLRSQELDDLEEMIENIEKVKANPREVHHELMEVYTERFELAKLKNAKEAHVSPFMTYFENAMRESGINKILNASNANSDLTDMVQNIYLDTYLEGRTKFGGSVSRTPYLLQLESAMVEAFNLPRGQNNEEMILQHAGLPDGATKAIVEKLYTRAVAEGLGQGNKMIFLNAAKLVLKMGDKATAHWNALVEKTLGDPEMHLPSNKKIVEDKDGKEKLVSLSDDELEASKKRFEKFDLATAYKKLGNVVNNAKKLYSPQILINVLKSADIPQGFSPEQYDKLHRLIKSLEATKKSYGEFHQAFMKTYLDVYIDERKDGGKLMKFLESSIRTFNETTKIDKPWGNMFLGMDVKKSMIKSVTDIEIFRSTANPKLGFGGENRAALAEQAFARAAAALDKAAALPASDKKAREYYIDTAVAAAKAVVKMTTAEQPEALLRWQALAARENTGMSLTTLEQSGKLNSDSIENLFKSTVKDMNTALLEDSRSAPTPRASGVENVGMFAHPGAKKYEVSEKQALTGNEVEANVEEKVVSKTSIRVGNK